MERLNVYKARKDRFEKEANDFETISWRYSYARLGTFLILIIALLLFFTSNLEDERYLYVLLLGIIGFAILIRKHQVVIAKTEQLKVLAALNEKEITEIESFKSQFDGGIEFATGSHDYLYDLDLFGKQSIFAFLNRTATFGGKEQLAELLKKPFKEEVSIYSTQEAVGELSQKIDFRQNFYAHGLHAEESNDSIKYLIDWVSSPPQFLNNSILKIWRVIASVLGLTALVYAIVTNNFLPLIFIGCINLGTLGILAKRITKEHNFIGKKQNILSTYVKLLQLMLKEDNWNAKILKTYSENTKSAEVELNRLVSIIRFFDQRLNVLIGLVWNIIVLYDIHCLFALEKWKERNKDYIKEWMGMVSNLDVLNSIATFSYNNPEFNFPQPIFSYQNKIIAKEASHPLINRKSRVYNDFTLGSQEQKVYVVTGSNMAGKSTFLRSVALNLLLAKIGAPVCAAEFQFSNLRIISSMRVQDSISSNTSYFQAELLRMQYIVNELEKKEETLVILDEILKGTNSDDKLQGSQLLVHKFVQMNALIMIATHDLELGKMQEEYPLQVHNLCFESIILDDELSFDYKLREGIAVNKNATFLMRKMKIV